MTTNQMQAIRNYAIANMMEIKEFTKNGIRYTKPNTPNKIETMYFSDIQLHYLVLTNGEELVK